MRVISDPQSGRIGRVVYVNSRYGQLARQYVPPRNPRTPEQQCNRSNFGAVSSRWRALTPEQRDAWCMASANKYIVGSTGRQVALNGYNFFVGTNTRRAELGLPQFDLPPAEPAFSPNPVAELVAANLGGAITLKLRVPSQPAQHTVVQGAAPVSTGVRCVQHFPFLGLLPSAVDGWSDITELYVTRYGVLPVGKVVFIRTCQHIDGWTDVPKLTSARIPAAAH
jgi:hypothetical protein